MAQDFSLLPEQIIRLTNFFSFLKNILGSFFKAFLEIFSLLKNY
jgi:hypothetical protein